MYLYFSSDYPAILKLNGIYYGKIDGMVKTCKFENSQPPFVEVCSLTPLESQINLLVDTEFLSSPPSSVALTDLKGGYFIKFLQSHNTNGFSVIAQEKFQNAVITVFSENGYKLSIETPNDFFAQPLPFKIDHANIFQKQANGEFLYFIELVGNKTYLGCFSANSAVKTLFFKQVDDFSIQEQFTTTEKLQDIAKHQIVTTWEYANGELKATDKVVNKSANFCIEQLPQRLIPYAFLEEFLVGGEYLDYLSGFVKDNANKLGGFLKNYIGVMPPPTFRNIEEVGLIYHDKENVYHVEYYTFEIENGKIININKS